MDYIVIIAIIVAFVASTYNDAQKRRRRAQNAHQKPQMQPDEKCIPEMPIPKPARPKRPQFLPKEIPAEVQAAMEYSRQRVAKNKRAAHAAHAAQASNAHTSVSHANQSAQAGQEQDKQQGSEERFDLERAVIYSEILQPKYKEYE